MLCFFFLPFVGLVWVSSSIECSILYLEIFLKIFIYVSGGSRNDFHIFSERVKTIDNELRCRGYVGLKGSGL